LRAVAVHAYESGISKPSGLRQIQLGTCKGWLARFATSSSAIVVELGGWDHLEAEGEGCRAKLTPRENAREGHCGNVLQSHGRSGRENNLMVALDVVRSVKL
jgi:hypothetical protein